MCCREGMDKKPQAPKSLSSKGLGSAKPQMAQQKISDQMGGAHGKSTFEKAASAGVMKPGTAESRRLSKIHNKSVSTQQNQALSYSLPSHQYNRGSQPILSLLGNDETTAKNRNEYSHYDTDWTKEIDVDDLPSPDKLLSQLLVRNDSSLPSDNDLDVPDPKISSSLEVADKSSRIPLSSSQRGRKRKQPVSNSKIFGCGLADDFDLLLNAPKQKHCRVSADFLYEEEGPRCNVPIESEPKRHQVSTSQLETRDFISSSSFTKQPEKPRSENQCGDSGQASGESGTLSHTEARGNEGQVESTSDLVSEQNHTRTDETSGSVDSRKQEDERLRQEQEQLTKWEGLDPDFITAYQDIIEII